MIDEKRQLPFKTGKEGKKIQKQRRKGRGVHKDRESLTYCAEDWPWHGGRREEPLGSNAIVAPCPVSGSKSVLNHCEDSEPTPSPGTVNQQSRV